MASGEVEFILDATSVIAADAGASGTQTPAKAYDGDFSTTYTSVSTGAWLGIDLGSGCTAKLTRVWFAPRADLAEEVRCLPATFDYSDDTTTWTNVGAITDPQGNNCYPFVTNYEPLLVMNALVFTAPAAGHRYYRYASTGGDGITDVAEIAFGGPFSSISGAVRWVPCRPIISPGSGAMQAGLPVTISCPTTDAAIYYTTDGTTPALSGGVPQGTTTLYSGAITLASSSSSQVIKAIAYHASGNTTTSYVASASFLAPGKYVPDTGVAANSFNLPAEIYDDRGVKVNAHGGGILYVPSKGRYYWYGQFIGEADTDATGKHKQRGVYCYSSADLYSWHWEGMVAPRVPTGWTSVVIVERPHVFYNPNAADPNKAYVLTAHIDNVGYTLGNIGIATSASPTGPFVWQSKLSSGTDVIRDSSNFVDPNNGNAYVIGDQGTSGSHVAIKAYQLDSSTDFTSLTGSVTTLDSSGGREAPQLFYYSGYYYLMTSTLTAYGGNTAQVKYKAATTLAGLNAASYTTIWSSAPTLASVANNAQPAFVLQPQGRSGFILGMDWWACGQSPLFLSIAKRAWYPIPLADISAGTLSIPFPTSWDLSSLPQNAVVHPISCLGVGT